MKKFYFLLIALALTSVQVSAQKLTLKRHHQVDAATMMLRSQLKKMPLEQNSTASKAPRRVETVGSRTLSYCEGAYDNALGLGSVGSNDSLAAAILFTKEQLRPYKGGKIDKIRVPVKQKNGMSKAYGWVAIDDYTSPAEIVQVGTLSAGYQELTLENPIEIDGEHDIYIGASFVLKKTATASQSYCLLVSSAVDEVSGGLFIGYGSKSGKNFTWDNMSETGYGNFAVEAEVSGVTMQTVDAMLYDFSVDKTDVSMSDKVTVSVKVMNNGADNINSFDVECYVAGTKVCSTSHKLDNALTTDHIEKVGIEVSPCLTSTMEGATLEVKIVNVNGNGDDDDMTNNSGSLSINVYEKMFPHNLLVEEGTGQWCGFCVRGQVAMEEMHNKNLDNYVGVAVHYGYFTTQRCDTMAFAVNSQGYMYGDYVGYSGYPSAVYDKTYSDDPGYISEYYNLLTASDSKAKIFGRAYWDGDNVVVSGDVEFCCTAPKGSDYRILTYLLEDNVGPYYQQNYYSGGGYGEMGGFEKLPSATPVVYNDVLRGVYPAPSTTSAMVGEKLTEAAENGVWPWKVFEFENTYEITSQVSRLDVSTGKIKLVDDARYTNKDNLRLALALIDYNNGGKVINSCKVTIYPDKASAISGVKTDVAAPVEYYNINGVRLDGPATKGIYIEKQGSKVTKRIAR